MSTLSNHDSTVNSFYLAFYGRPADPAGLKFWSQHLAASNGELGVITQAFATSEEAQVRFGADSLDERISEIYQQLFNRTIDADGLAYWSGVVEQGNASLADVSMAILNGARGSDATLSALRQQAADDFTAQVEASGSQYSGYASIEAARILVRAVTPTATDADLAQLVKAAVSFADTATKTPAVVEAIAVNTTLLALFDTVRGKGDPVALAQALADTAKAAAGDPATLASLLRGGGMDKVLKVMPAAATLKDVVKALAEGGLPAAVEVVYPSAPVDTPSPTPAGMQLYFDKVAQSIDDHVADTTTNLRHADVTFRYTGKDLVAGQYFQYSTDGENWFREGMDIDTAKNTVTIEELYLGGKALPVRLAGGAAQESTANVTTKVQLRAVEGGRVIADASEQIVYDGAAPDATLGFYGFDGKAANGSATSQTVVDVNFMLTGELGAGDFIEYRMLGGDTWVRLDGKYVQDGIVTIPGVDLRTADQTVQVRVTDNAGNANEAVVTLIDGPAGVQAPPTFFVRPASTGLTVYTSGEGTLRLVDGKDVAILTSTAVGEEQGLKISYIGAQEKMVKGAIEFVPDGGSPITDPNVAGIVVTLGTDLLDTMSGSVVWGFDGDDIITGTAGDDSLFGGDGNDTISGGTGRDAIHGGPGADLIDLGVDEDADRVLYETGDAAGPVFVDGGSTEAIDKITNFGVGDSLRISSSFGPTPTLRTHYLTEASTNNDFAVVRGSDAGGKFVRGDSASDDDYMVQWMDGGVVNSTILRDLGAKAPDFVGSPGSNSIAFKQVVMSDYVSAVFNMASSLSLAWMLVSDGVITGVANAETFKLVDYSTGVAKGLPEYDALPGSETTHNSNTLHFKAELTAAIYRMSWENDTFATSDGFVNAHEVYFAGGSDGRFYHRGFELGAAPTIIHGDVTRGAADVENEGFITDGLMDVTIQTGRGNDVIVDQGSKVTVVYDRLDEAAQDLIFGFDHADRVLLDGDIAAALRKDDDNAIAWALSGNDILAKTEGVVVDLAGYIYVGTTSGGWTGSGELLGELSRKLNVDAIAKGEHLLILANGVHGDSSILLMYQRLDEDSVIDADELTTIAMFSHGAITTDNITLTGVQPDFVGIP